MACETKRDFPGRRWLAVVLRGVHLVAVILLGAAVFGQAAPLDIHAAGQSVFATGLAVWALDIWAKPQHLGQWAGLSMFIKLALIAAMLVWSELYAPLFWLVVIWSAVFSHAPGSFRNAQIRLRPIRR
jgi:hypothetical protein